MIKLTADGGYEDESDAVSPRTMAAAVQRLQQFTQDASAEEAAGPAMWSDVYSEADRADELSASGAEADCELLVYSLVSKHPQHTTTGCKSTVALAQEHAWDRSPFQWAMSPCSASSSRRERTAAALL